MKQQAIHSLTVHQFVPSHSLNSFPHSPSIHSLSPHSPSIHSLTFGIPSIHSLTFPQIPPIHSLNSFPHKSHSLTSHIPSQVTFPQFPSHYLRSLQFIPSIHSFTFPQFTPSHPSIRSINSFPHIRYSLNSLPHIPSDSSNSFPQSIPSIHSLTSHIPSQVTFPQFPSHHLRFLQFIPSIHSFTFPQFTPSHPSIRSINSFPRFPSIESFSSLNSFPHVHVPSIAQLNPSLNIYPLNSLPHIPT